VRSKQGTTNRLRRVLQEIIPCRRKSLLDFGSGTGKVYQDLLSSGIFDLERIAMVDVSGEMCRLAEEKVSSKTPVIVINGDEFSSRILEFAPYDVITMMQILHHLPMPGETLMALRRYASEDAVLVALTPGPLYQSNIFPYEANSPVDLVGRRTLTDWEEIIESSGWRIETIYDDRFVIDFCARKDYVSFIDSIGITNRVLGYKVSEVSTKEDPIDSEESQFFVRGQYLTFFCRLG